MAIFTNVFGIILFVFLYKLFRQHFRTKLPGPRRWPFLGTMLSFDMARMMHDDQLLDVARRYGDICALRAFGEDFILLNSYDVIREAAILKPSAFVNRTLGKRFTWSQVDPDREGIAFNDLEKVSEVRNVSLKIFRSLGVGRSTMEDLVTSEATLLTNQMQARNGSSFDPSDDVTFRMANVLHRVLFGERSRGDDEAVRQTLLNMKRTEESFSLIFIFDSLPLLRHLPFFRRHFATLVTAQSFIRSTMTAKATQSVKDTQARASLQQNHEHFSEAYAAKYGTHSYEFKKVLPPNLLEFFAAGTESSASTILWMLCFLANRPKIQEKLHDAICEVIGQDGKYAMNCKVPYLEAVVCEATRMSPGVPIALPPVIPAENLPLAEKLDIPGPPLDIPSKI